MEETSELRPVCMYCGEAIGEDQEPCTLTLKVPWSNAEGDYWSHPVCLQESVHREIPLHLLSLRDGHAVYGAKGGE